MQGEKTDTIMPKILGATVQNWVNPGVPKICVPLDQTSTVPGHVLFLCTTSYACSFGEMFPFSVVHSHVRNTQNSITNSLKRFDKTEVRQQFLMKWRHSSIGVRKKTRYVYHSKNIGVRVTDLPLTFQHTKVTVMLLGFRINP